MAKYRKRPVVIEAFRLGFDNIPDWFMTAVTSNDAVLHSDVQGKTTAEIHTLEGWHHANYGDYIIRGVKGEIYPCKPDIFAKTYEFVNGSTNMELCKKLVELLRVTPCKDVDCDKCKDAGDDCWLGKHADYLIANGVTLNQWISVEDEKPKRRGHYFIAFKFKGSDMRFFGEAMWHDDIPDNGFVKGDHFSNEGVEGMYVTHWMKIPPLPRLPKEIEE